MRDITENEFAHLAIGFAFGVLFFFIVLLIGASCSASDYEYKYIDIGNLTCLEISSEIVSCDWTGFKE